MASISFFNPRAKNYAIGYEILHLRRWLEPGERTGSAGYQKYVPTFSLAGCVIPILGIERKLRVVWLVRTRWLYAAGFYCCHSGLDVRVELF